LVLTVIVAVPVAFAVTRPVELTVAIVELLDHVTDLLEAFVGNTVADNCCVALTSREAEVGDTVTPVTATDEVVTLIAEVAVFPPSLVLTVIVAVPTALAVTSPVELTVAIVELLDQVTVLLVAFVGNTVAVSCCVLLIAVIVAEVGDTVTPVTTILETPQYFC
jgi:hypothetical protein